MARPAKRKEVAAAVAAVAATEPEQLAIDDLLGVAAAEPVRRGRGRPPGALNRKTTDMIAYLEALGFEPPMLQLCKVAAADTAALAAALRCSKVDAFDRQQQARVALLPYFHAKMPIEAVVKAEAAVGIILGVAPGDPEPGAAGDDRPSLLTLVGSEQDQWDSDA